MISGFVDADRDLLDLLAGLGTDVRSRVHLPLLGSMMLPFDLAMLMRLSEHALHSWDIRVGADPRAEVAADAARLLVDLFPLDVLSLLLTRQLADRVAPAVMDIAITTAADERRTIRLTLGDGAVLVPGDADPAGADAVTGRIELPSPATWVRLLTGRLDADHRPAGMYAQGAPTLDELWQALQEEPADGPGAQSRS